MKTLQPTLKTATIWCLAAHMVFIGSAYAGMDFPLSVPDPVLTVTATQGTKAECIRVSWSANAGATAGYEVWRNTTSSAFTSTRVASVPQSSTTYDDATALEGPHNVYWYWIKAVDADGSSNYSWNAAQGWRNYNMTVPANVKATQGVHADKVTVTYDGDAHATIFEIYRNTTDNFVTAAKVASSTLVGSCDDAPPEPGTTYFYWVIARNTFNGSDVSVSAQSMPAAYGWRHVAPPANVAATDGSSTSFVRVSWSLSTGATGYDLYRGTVNNSAVAAKLNQIPIGTPSYDDLSAVPEIHYYYWLEALRTGSPDSEFSIVDEGWRETEAGTPTGIAATDGDFTDKITVSWSRVPGGRIYEVWRATTNALVAAVKIAETSELVSTYDDTTAPTGRTSYYWIRARNQVGAGGFSLSPETGWRRPLPPPAVSVTDGVYTEIYTDRVVVTWKNHVYEAVATYKPWKDAQRECEQRGGHLATIGSKSENDLVGSLMKGKGMTTAWLGGSDEKVEGAWNWVTGEPLSFTSWDALRPNSAAGNSDDFLAIIDAATAGMKWTDKPNEVSSGTQPGYVFEWDCAGWEIWRSVGNAPAAAELIGNLVDPAAQSFEDKTAAINVGYNYWIKAKGAAGNSLFSMTDPGWRASAAPTSVAASDGTFYAKIRVTWTASAGSLGYEIYRHTASDSSRATLVGEAAAGATSYDDYSAYLEDNFGHVLTYFYWVKAKNLVGSTAFSNGDAGFRNGAMATYTLTVINGSGSGKYDPASVITIKANQIDGRSFARWTGASVADPAAAVTTITVTGDMTVTAIYNEVVYTVSASAGEGGALSCDTESNTTLVVRTIAYNQACPTITAVAATGYAFVKWTLDGKDYSTSSALSVKAVTKDMAFAAVFVKGRNCQVTFKAGEHGALASGTDSGKASLVLTVENGKDCAAVTAVPTFGYNFTGWTGGIVSLDNPLIVKAVTADMAITANFSLATPGEGFIVTDDTTDIIVTFLEYNAAYGYKLFLDNTNALMFTSAEVGKVVNLGKFAIGTELIFRLDVVTTGYSYFTGASERNPDKLIHTLISKSSAQSWRFGFEDMFNGGDKDYNDCIFKVEGGVASFVSLKMKVADGLNGTLSCGSDVGKVSIEQRLESGKSSAAVTAVPSVGCKFTGWTGDYVGSENPLTLKNITQPMSVTATFEMGNCMVSFVAGANGSVRGPIPQTVVYGAATTPVTAVPSEGYLFTGWTGDYTGSDNPLTIASVSEDMMVTANFQRAMAKLTIAVDDDKMGSVTPSGVIDAEQGVALAITATPAKNNSHFTGWIVSGNAAVVNASSVATEVILKGDALLTATFSNKAATTSTLTLQVTPAGAATLAPAADTTTDVITSLPHWLRVVSVKPGYLFTGWKIADKSAAVIDDAGAAMTAVTLKDDAIIVATFAKDDNKKAILTMCVAAADGGTATPAGGPEASGGAMQKITAVAIDGYGFVQWTAEPAASAVFADEVAASTTVTLTADATVTALFVRASNIGKITFKQSYAEVTSAASGVGETWKTTYTAKIDGDFSKLDESTPFALQIGDFDSQAFFTKLGQLRCDKATPGKVRLAYLFGKAGKISLAFDSKKMMIAVQLNRDEVKTIGDGLVIPVEIDTADEGVVSDSVACMVRFGQKQFATSIDYVGKVMVKGDDNEPLHNYSIKGKK